MFKQHGAMSAQKRSKYGVSMVRRGGLAALFALACGVGLSHAQGVLNVGLVPAEDPRLVVSENQALLDHLHNALQLEIKPFVATDYNGVIEALRAKKLDLALLGPFSYVLAVSVADVEAFAVPETQKQGASYRAVIIARKDRNIASLKDLKDKTFAFVDPSSTSGHLFPKAALMKAGYDPDSYFSRVIFSGGHDASALAVQNGKVDAAAVADVLAEMAFKKGVLKQEDVTVIWTSGPIPGAPFVYRRDLPEDLKAKVREALSEVRDMPWGAHSVIKRWAPTNDAAYDVVRDTAKLLKLDLKKMK
jgi:phosphonate transport system substrate-binding protein